MEILEVLTSRGCVDVNEQVDIPISIKNYSISHYYRQMPTALFRLVYGNQVKSRLHDINNQNQNQNVHVNVVANVEKFKRGKLLLQIMVLG